MSSIAITAADLFCGAGGTSTGLRQAVEQKLGRRLQLLAVNHWEIAISTHSKNHPDVAHLCESLDNVDPRKVIPGGRLDILVASPECTHHSNARGGRPMSDQSRASAYHILRWCEALHVENLLVENVPEFRDWGPLGANGRPLKSKKGQLYRHFIDGLRALGYRQIREVILNAADYGDATTRRRLFIMARRSTVPLEVPAPTHAKDPAQPNLFGRRQLKPWRPAREIIDWTLQGESIFSRKKPLSDNTLRRIFAGLQKYSGLPFVLPNEGVYRGNAPRSTDEPVPTCTSRGGGSVVQPQLLPFMVNLRGTEPSHLDSSAKPLDAPVPALTGGRNVYLAEPELIPLPEYLVRFFGDMGGFPLDVPLPTVTANYEHYGLARPFLIKYHGSHAGRSDGDRRSHDIGEPVPTVDGSNRVGLVIPYSFLVPFYGERDGQGPRTHDVDSPMPTATAQGRHGLAEAFLVKYYGTGAPAAVTDPLDTVTAVDRFGLIETDRADLPQYGLLLDIRFRMLQPHELAAAMGFPKSYHFTGTRGDAVRQIGNAVPVNTAAALCEALLAHKAAARRPARRRAA